jgi:PAS domain-containing protein
MVTVMSIDGSFRFANGAFQAWCGRPVDQILGRKAHEILGEAEFQRRWPWVEQAIAGKRVEFELDYPSRDEMTYLGIRYIPLRLVQLVRPTDAVARRGGDEFVIALLGTSSQADAQIVAEKVLAAASAPFNVGQSRIHVGASIGIATDSAGDSDWHELIDRADANLLNAKGAGRGRHSDGLAPKRTAAG